MFKKYLTASLAILVINLSMSVLAFGETKAEKEAKFAGKIRSNVAKLGTGKDARIEVKLKDGTKLKGYVSDVNENAFIVISDNTGTATEVQYSAAKSVKGKNLITGDTIWIVAGIIAVIVIVAVYATHSKSCPCTQ